MELTGASPKSDQTVKWNFSGFNAISTKKRKIRHYDIIDRTKPTDWSCKSHGGKVHHYLAFCALRSKMTEDLNNGGFSTKTTSSWCSRRKCVWKNPLVADCHLFGSCTISIPADFQSWLAPVLTIGRTILDVLYQKQILDYAKKSRASDLLDQPTHTATLDNTICGDRVEISLEVKSQHIEKIGVTVRGCALCEAGAGLAIECFTGQTDQAIRQLTDDFTTWLTNHGTKAPTPQMQHFTPVQTIRNRHKCVLLASHATLKALSTEWLCHRGTGGALFRSHRHLVKNPQNSKQCGWKSDD